MLHQSGEMTETQRADFDTWLHQSGTHKRAYDSVVKLWGELDWSETLNREALNAGGLPVQRARGRGPVLPIAGGLIAAATALAAVLLNQSPANHQMPAPQPVLAETLFETAIGEIRTFELEDGSEVTLAGHSTLAVMQMEQERIVELRKGDGFFDVSKDPQKPFTVKSSQLSVTVLGTQFEINTKPDHEDVSVAEGSVRVAAVNGGETVQLSAGDRAVVQRGQVETSTFDLTQSANWRSGRLSFVNVPLKDLIAETNQYYPGGIYLGEKDVSGLIVSASFRTDQVETAISGIARSLGLSVMETDTGALVLIHAPDGK
jgi:transmembrane sensor